MSGCPVKPNVPDPPPTATGGPFYDCGLGPAGYRAPSPTVLPHGFGDSGMLSGSSLCLTPFEAQGWWENAWPGGISLPDIPITDSDRIVHNSSVIDGDVVFYGERVQWLNQTGFGAVKGEYRCAPGAWMIEVDGECLCPEPAPEPGIVGALVVGLVALVMGSRAKRTTRSPR